MLTCLKKNLNTKRLKKSKQKINQVRFFSHHIFELINDIIIENEGEEEEKSEHGEEEAEDEV